MQQISANLRKLGRNRNERARQVTINDLNNSARIGDLINLHSDSEQSLPGETELCYEMEITINNEHRQIFNLREYNLSCEDTFKLFVLVLVNQ